jgi:hypothetical protein
MEKDYETYLDEVFLPYVRKVMGKYSNRVKEQASGFHDFLSCLGKSLQTEPCPDEVIKLTY